MGCKQTSYRIRAVVKFPCGNRNNVFLIHVNQLYNFYQDSFFHPENYVFFDLRSPAAFLKETLQGAISVYRNKPCFFLSDSECNLSSKEKAKLDRRHFLRKGSCSWISRKLQSVVEINQLRQFFHETAHNKIVVVFNATEVTNEPVAFIEELQRHNVEPTMVGILIGGFKSLRKRHRLLLTTSPSFVTACGPTEVFFSKSLAGLAPALYLSGLNILMDQWDFINVLRITVIFNLSSQNRAFGQRLEVKTFLSRFGIFDYATITRQLYLCLEKGQRVLLLDDNNGAEVSAVCCAMFLIYLGIPHMNSVLYVKECKPSVDLNYLMNAFTFSLIKDSIAPIMEPIVSCLSNYQFLDDSHLKIGNTDILNVSPKQLSALPSES